MSAEPISPELALVCPDLRATAIDTLRPRPPKRPRPAGHTRAALPDPAVRADTSRVVAAYVRARATDLLAIIACIALFVLVFAAVAGLAGG